MLSFLRVRRAAGRDQALLRRLWRTVARSA